MDDETEPGLEMSLCSSIRWKLESRRDLELGSANPENVLALRVQLRQMRLHERIQ